MKEENNAIDYQSIVPATLQLVFLTFRIVATVYRVQAGKFTYCVLEQNT